MNEVLFKAEDALLSGSDVKKSFDLNYVKMLFQKHPQLDRKYIINFLHRAQLTGADPRQDQIYLIERNNKIPGKHGGPDAWEKVGIIVYSYGYTLGLVQSHSQYQGMVTKIEERERVLPAFKRDQYGKMALDLEAGTSKRKELCAISVISRGTSWYEYVAWISDYYQASNPKWASSPDTMLRKCAEVAACRHAFADIVQGFYAHEEIDSAFGERVVTEIKEQVTVAEVEAKAETLSLGLEESKSRDQIKRKQMGQQIVDITNIVTKGMTMLQKSEWVSKHLGVLNIADLAKVSDEYLSKKLEDIRPMLTELKVN